MTAVLSLIAAFSGYSLHAIALAGQKIGLTAANERRIRGVAIWILSTLSMPVGVFLILYAVSIGNASLVGAMSGSGLASLAVFSHLYMGERITKRELVGVFTIVASAILIGSFRIEADIKNLSFTTLYIYLPAICAAYFSLWLLLRQRERFAGIIIAGFAGALGGFVPLFQKISTSSLGLSNALLHLQFKTDTALTSLLNKGVDVLSNPWALAWILISLVSMVVMQFAHRRGKAIQLIPAFAANTIAIPVVGGVVAFHEHLHPFQWIGVIMIFSGVLLLTIKTGHVMAPSSRDSRSGHP